MILIPYRWSEYDFRQLDLFGSYRFQIVIESRYILQECLEVFLVNFMSQSASSRRDGTANGRKEVRYFYGRRCCENNLMVGWPHSLPHIASGYELRNKHEARRVSKHCTHLTKKIIPTTAAPVLDPWGTSRPFRSSPLTGPCVGLAEDASPSLSAAFFQRNAQMKWA